MRFLYLPVIGYLREKFCLPALSIHDSYSPSKDPSGFFFVSILKPSEDFVLNTVLAHTHPYIYFRVFPSSPLSVAKKYIENKIGRA